MATKKNKSQKPARTGNRSARKEPKRRKGRDYQVFVSRSFSNQVDPKTALMAAGLAHYQRIRQTG